MCGQVMSNVKQRVAESIESFRFSTNIVCNPAQRKYFGRWIASMQRDYFTRQHKPWLTFEAIDILENLDLRNKLVFEYGSGGSTLFWLDKGAQVISIEHDREWYQRVRTITADNPQLDYRLIEAEKIENARADIRRDPSNPSQYLSDDSAFIGYHFRQYVEQIDEFADQFFDLVLIDGRARPSCITHAARKVKVGGYLVLDNADRAYYLAHTAHALVNFECRKTEGVGPGVNLLSCTSLYHRTS